MHVCKHIYIYVCVCVRVCRGGGGDINSTMGNLCNNENQNICACVQTYIYIYVCVCVCVLTFMCVVKCAYNIYEQVSISTTGCYKRGHHK